MLSSDNQIAVMIMPATASAAATLFGWCDVKGFNFVDIDVIMQTVTTTNPPTVLKLGETDDTTNHTVTSDMTDITEFVGGGVDGFTISVTAQTVTRNGYCTKFRVDCRKRQRYLGISITMPVTGATQQIGVLANLSAAEESPDAANARMIGLVAG